MRDVLEFDHYRFKNGFGQPSNPHECVRGPREYNSDEWTQFDAFSTDERLPAPGIPDGECKKELVEIIPSNEYFPYKRIYRLKTTKKFVSLSEIAKETKGLKYVPPPIPSEEEIAIYNQYLYRDAHEYILEFSADGENWKLKAKFVEGEMSRFGKPFSPEIALMEAKYFKEYWRPQHQGYDTSVLREIENNKHVRIIIEV